HKGIYVAGVFESPKDIPETVMTASNAAALSAELLSDVRGTMVTKKEYPAERDVSGEEPRIGVFVCRCGINIAGVVDVPAVMEYAKTLPRVCHAEENLYTCSTDTQVKIREAIKEHNLNRVVVASCSPRTHEPLFRDTCQEAALNKYLCEMTNIRDQCSWVHARYPEKATEKAKDLVRMAVSRAAELEPLTEIPFNVKQKGLVVGGGLAGMTAALGLANQGYETHLIEKSDHLGGNALNLQYTLEGIEPQKYLKDLINKVENHKLINVYKNANILEYSGHVGNFTTVIDLDGKREELEHGIVIIATGGVEYNPREYLYGNDDRVMTQVELEQKLAKREDEFKQAKNLVMIQCVGSRDEDHPYCSRVCCSAAIKNSLKLKEINPDLNIFILYRDVRTYSFKELYYKKARETGVKFIRYKEDKKPEILVTDKGTLKANVFDENIITEVQIEPDFVVLSAAIRPNPDGENAAQVYKLSYDPDGFFMEAHMKLRPLDFTNVGMFLCGLAHSPKFAEESISQAKGAVSRACTILSKAQMMVGGVVAEVDADRCVACLTCVRVCPYGVPRINEEGVAEIAPAACQGCGSCASACPRKAIQLNHYKDEQIMSKCDVLYATG
ncbi:MAG: FAD-dependent oxidoreductase, partial [Proteobacteria bacterium]|nr:FAD-dependent oxidoreductase [Pseudomonadota bacterium]